LLTEFAETFPDTTAMSAPYVSDGRWVSCGSAAAALELILREISVRFGQAARFDAAAMFSNDPSRPFDTDPVLAAALMHPNAKVRQVLGLMIANVAKPLALPQLAKAAGMTLRSLARLFETELMMSPGRYYLNFRLARARELTLQSGLSATEVASLCGFSSASVFSRAYRRAFSASRLAAPINGVSHSEH
jgi:transcriptional regulator GlxA family with amidase domain